MARITKEEILNLARISNVEVHESEIEGLIKQIESVLTYAARVQEVGDVTFPSTKNVNVFREDVAIPSDNQAILAQAPAREANYFVVPAILEHK